VYEFIDSCRVTPEDSTAEYAYPAVKMCAWLAVSTSGFYDWRARAESATAARHRHLTDLVVAIFDANHGRYGYRRVHAVLARSGVAAGPELVRQIMAEQGLVACQPRPWRVSLTEADDSDHRIPDLVGRDFTAETPGQKMVGDITYIDTWEGWVYLATVIDCHTKAVVGYAFGEDYKTPLITAAITHAAEAIDLPPDAVFHSDRGSNYTSHAFATALAGLGIRQSVGRTGICYDNALAESFFAAYKNELAHRTVYPTRAHARRDGIRYIHWYNTTRLHSGLGYTTPHEKHRTWLKAQDAA
jgi:transposase InsO family protein